ncbi:MAG: DUF4160 domain-containing protein [Gemmatimonadaceae bacterium]
MPFADHDPPHFHARYGAHRISVGILDGRVIDRFPPRARALVLEWRTLHEAERLENWARAQPPTVDANRAIGVADARHRGSPPRA